MLIRLGRTEKYTQRVSGRVNGLAVILKVSVTIIFYRTQNGNILLYAVRAEDRQIRAYKINQINDALITNQNYVPRY